jgi:uncharacterized protein (DUF2141 family)
MKKRNFGRYVFFAMIGLYCLCSFVAPTTGNLVVSVSNIAQSGGELRIVVYNSASTFLNPKGYAYLRTVPITNQTTAQVTFERLPYGYYAVTMYHDLNSNHNMDKSALGVPEEPYALSNNVNVKWRRPTFDETKIQLAEPSKNIALRLVRWKDR